MFCISFCRLLARNIEYLVPVCFDIDLLVFMCMILRSKRIWFEGESRGNPPEIIHAK